jgi:protein Mpv17
MSSSRLLIRHVFRARHPPLRSLSPYARRLNSTNPPKTSHNFTPIENTTKSSTSDSDAVSKSIPSPAFFWLNSLSAPLRFYSRAQAKRPYVTQLISTLIVYLVGDLVAQNLPNPEPDGPYDPIRTSRALLIGGLVAIPAYKWFVGLGSSFNYGSKVLSISIKVVLTQLIYTPIFIVYFFGMQSALTGSSPREIVERLVNTVPTSLVNSFKVWPAVTAINFAFIPSHFRSVFTSKYLISNQGSAANISQV